MRLDRADETIAEHPWSLSEQYARPPRQPTVNFGHDPAQRLLAHEHGSDRVLVLVEALHYAPGMAAGNAEDHLDPGLFEHARDERARRHFFGQHRLDRHPCPPPSGDSGAQKRRSLPSRESEDNV